MSHLAIKSLAVWGACLCLTACVTQREIVLAPEASGIVLDAETGMPVEGAEVRYVGIDTIAAVTTGADGRFALPGRTEVRTIVVMPVGGVFRDSTLVQTTASGRAEAFASAAYIQSGQPAQALYRVTVLMFAADAGETPLHDLMRDCIKGDEQEHALQLAGYVAGIDPENPPAWLDEEALEALQEHLGLALPSAGFQSCERMNEAYAMFRAQTQPLEAIATAAYLEKLPPHLRPVPVQEDR